MLHRTGRTILAVILTATTALCLVMVQPSDVAKASGPTADISSSRVQRGETIKITPNDMCPNVFSFQTVDVIFVDANSEVFIQFAQGSDSMDGVWGPGFYVIPEEAALGQGVIYLDCYAWGGIGETLFYDPIDIEIVPQSTKMAVDRVNWGSTATLSSIVPCDPNSDVRVEMYSSEYLDTPDNQWVTYVSSTVEANANGNWSYAVNLHPGVGGFSGAVNPQESLQSPGGSYYFRAACLTGGSVAYDSLRFTTIESRYVALGDSYSSGEGSYNYDIDSGVCHRSSDAFAYYVGRQANLGLPLLVACSGAQTYDIAHTGVAGVPQRNSLSLDTEVVTLTIGGNDVGFEEVLRACVHHPENLGFGCAADPYLPNAVIDRLAALEGEATTPVYTEGKLVKSITQVLLEIEEYAPNAKIYISGYPKLFGSSSAYFTTNGSAPGGFACGLAPFATVSYTDAQWMNGVADDLNGIIQAEVNSAQLLGVNAEYVPPLFGGHGHCDSGESWLHGVTFNGDFPPDPSPESMHPIDDGVWQGYGLTFTAAID